ncbi:hypothetical protein BX661DRAFT_185566 [Kickxella alabastrina]|uniref:uncharacterized protein n=1 Tax=Kickxella alabastrina TaxID=61397 RepID=UPI0022202302|nr:uncharacterized protein BX661DRAFT_185566 [Kickxella alabastrina]KAI7824576.1 hypothetical protein BX661DRAFT_185566 [Kickxella alabastrina]KAJ1936965.1 hypothetical protein GGF37_005397 [Kickxella alabastrina]
MRLIEQLSATLFAATLVSGWETTQMPEKIRKELCAEQVLFCTNICGGQSSTREAFCNVNTLGSKCTCTNGAESAIRRYQWPAYQRVCEVQRLECRNTCDHSNIAANEKAFCFNSCDSRLACNTENAPDLKVMVQKYDDPTTGSPPKPPVKPKENEEDKKQVINVNTGADAEKEDKIKEKKGPKDDSPKRRGGPVPAGKANSAAVPSMANGALTAAIFAAVALTGTRFL